MKNRKEAQGLNQVSFLKQDSYFQQFTDNLKSCYKFQSEEEKIELFVSYAIPKKIQDIVFQQKLPQNFQKDIVFNQILAQVFKDQNMKNYLNYYGKLEQKTLPKNQKDRKTSFYRTILKYLKQTNHKTQRWKNSYKFISDLQVKLSKNTISNQDIQQLFANYKFEIVEYLESPNSLNDFIFKNKSQVNKPYYVLHLQCLAIQAKNGRLSQYPFFSKSTFKKQIERMVRILYQQFLDQLAIKNKQLKQNKLSLSTQTQQSTNRTELFQNSSLACKKVQWSQKTSQVLVLDSLSQKSFEIIDEDEMKGYKNSFDHFFYMEMEESFLYQLGSQY